MKATACLMVAMALFQTQLLAAQPLRLTNLCFGKTNFTSPAREAVHYATFIAAPTVEFIRYEKGGSRYTAGSS